MTLTESPLVASVVETPADRKDLTNAFNAINNKRKDLDTLFSYLDGPQPLKYSTEKLKELFDNVNAHFEMNWMEVVVSSTLDRIQLEGFSVSNDKSASDKLNEVFDRLHLDLEADEAHKASLATSQAYVIVWKDEGETTLYYNDPRMCHVFYEDANPRKKRYAAKWFTRSDSRQEITLYYPDRLEHWASHTVKEGAAVEKADSFTLESSEKNTFGAIPVFDLKSEGEIFKVITLQDAVNKLFDDMLVAAEFGAIQQKWIISNADTSGLKNAANEIWNIPAGDGQGQQASVGEFTATPLSNFSNEIDKIANAIAIITRTPKHYFMNTGANISGEALLAMESPLTKKVMKRQRKFGAQWQDIAAFIAQLEGLDVKPSDITPIWKRAESIQPLTEMQTIKTGVEAGLPVETMARRQGWTDKELEEMGTQKLAAIKLQQEDRVPDVEQ